MSTEIVGASEDVKSFTKAHTAATTALTPLLLNSHVVVPLNTVAANADNVFAYKVPYLMVDKPNTEAWAALDKIYWDDTNKVFTTNSNAGANTLAGLAHDDALAADVQGYIDLDPATFA